MAPTRIFEMIRWGYGYGSRFGVLVGGRVVNRADCLGWEGKGLEMEEWTVLNANW